MFTRTKALQEMTRQHCYIVRALTQGGNMQIDHRQPVIQVTAELPGLYRFPQITSGRRDHPRRHLFRAGSTNLTNLPFLQYSQQLWLQLKR